MAKPLFHKIKTHPSGRKKKNIRENRANFNLRNSLQNIANKKMEEREEEEGDMFEAQLDMNDDMPQGGCAGGGCAAYDESGGASGEEEGDNVPFAQKLANALMAMKGNKYDRIQARKKRLNQQFRQGLGSKHNLVMYNPVNRLRKRRANTQLYRLKQRHDGAQSA